MQRTERDGPEDEQIESAGKELGLIVDGSFTRPPKVIRRVSRLS